MNGRQSRVRNKIKKQRCKNVEEIRGEIQETERRRNKPVHLSISKKIIGTESK
jgi:hypothetical protein